MTCLSAEFHQIDIVDAVISFEDFRFHIFWKYIWDNSKFEPSMIVEPDRQNFSIFEFYEPRMPVFWVLDVKKIYPGFLIVPITEFFISIISYPQGFCRIRILLWIPTFQKKTFSIRSLEKAISPFYWYLWWISILLV